jgi:hypothetical protein
MVRWFRKEERTEAKSKYIRHSVLSLPYLLSSKVQVVRTMNETVRHNETEGCCTSGGAFCQLPYLLSRYVKVVHTTGDRGFDLFVYVF